MMILQGGRGVLKILQLSRRAWRIYRNDGGVALRDRAVGKLRLMLGVPSARHRAFLARMAAADAAFDASHAVDTGGLQVLSELTIESANASYGNNHIAVLPSEFATVMSVAERDIGPLADVTFVDLGSGKGRALLLAAERGYGQVVGVEFAAELDAIARANIASRPDRARFTLVHGDAAAYELPAGPVLLYLYNSFDAPVVRHVAHRAMASWRASQRLIRVLYLNPRYASEWEQTGWREHMSAPGCIVFAPPSAGEQ